MAESVDPEHRVIINQARALLDAHEVIVAIAPLYKIDYSEYTGKFYVTARVEVSNGSFLRGVTEHRSTSQDAVIAYAERIMAVVAPEMVVVGAFTPERQQWRWEDGERWSSVPLTELIR